MILVCDVSCVPRVDDTIGFDSSDAHIKQEGKTDEEITYWLDKESELDAHVLVRISDFEYDGETYALTVWSDRNALASEITWSREAEACLSSAVTVEDDVAFHIKAESPSRTMTGGGVIHVLPKGKGE